MKTRKKKNYKRTTRRKYKGGADMCSICYDDLNEGDLYTHSSKKRATDRNSQVCNKQFHRSCMLKWHAHTKGRKCPLCRLTTDELKEPFRQIDSAAGLNISLVNDLDEFIIGNDYIFQYAKSSRNMWKHYVQGRIRVKLVEILDNSRDRRVGMEKMLHFKDMHGNSVFHVSNFIQLNPYNDDNHDDLYDYRIKIMNELRENPDKGAFEAVYKIVN